VKSLEAFCDLATEVVLGKMNLTLQRIVPQIKQKIE
jgi:hypothetical protein